MTNQLTIQFSAADRVLIIAPHPDDEAIATGGLIQSALQAGAAVKVTFLTKGENNPWPQRVMERKIIIRTEDKARFAKRREAEALASLAILGVAEEDVHFLGLRDQEISNLLFGGDLSALDSFLQLLRDWKPTFLFLPSPLDLHPDHSAFGVLVRDALKVAPELSSELRVLYHVVHPYSFPHENEQYCVKLEEGMMEKKRQALLCYETQCVFWKERLMSYVTPEERFHEEAFVVKNNLPVKLKAERSEDGTKLRLQIKMSLALWISSGAKLHIVGRIAGDVYKHVSFRVHPLWSRLFPGEHAIDVDFAAQIMIVTVALDNSLRDAGSVYAKLESPFVMYDQTGWIMV